MAAQTPGGSTWLVEPVTGTIQQVTNGLEADVLEAAGYRAFPTKAAAQAFVDSNSLAYANVQSSAIPDPVGSAVGAAESAATAVPDFLSRLTSGNLWIRIGEGVVGLILIGIGLNAMLKGKPMTVITGAAGTVGKAAIL